MLIKIKSLKSYKLNCIDGEVGKIKEFYFDDQHWAIRYLVADTGNWHSGKQVLISPDALSSVNVESEYISINLTKKQINDSPSLENNMPISRQFEEEYYDFYGWSAYWKGTNPSINYPLMIHDNEELSESNQLKKPWDNRLHSTNNMSGHHIQAIDGELGHIVDFIIDIQKWAIRYLIVDTQNWWLGKKVLISSKWIDHVSANGLKVFINLSRESIRLSPEYTEEALLTRDYESQLHKYYNRNVYWPDDPSEKKHLL